MGINFYAESVALLWTTAMRFGAPDPGRRGFRQCFAIRRGTQPITELRPRPSYPPQDVQPAGTQMRPSRYG
jgi:hypothetical protein